MPRNPDRPMIQCRECHDRYHLECLGMTIEEANGLNYVCSECSSAKECVSSITNS
ncbi:unnamed protein product [Linum tenue]|uniref:PHD-type domain-containing protein n=1 Tax=Linum tenue TaxID=586396 RepID=A0AAV0PF38_9ROSI|nr:unnamed protein product [Linum tenue]